MPRNFYIGAAMLVTAMVLLVAIAMLVLLWMRRGGSRAQGQVKSPVPWISDDVWQGLFPQGFLGRRNLTAGKLIVNPDPIEATDADRSRAPVAPIPEGVQPSPRGTLASLRKLLQSLPGPQSIRSAVWPICCGRLGTLISRQGGRKQLAHIESIAGPLDQAYLEREIDDWGGPETDTQTLKDKGWSDVLAGIRRGEHSGQGVNIFQCRGCGRVYVASSGP
ncbi:MAG: hypothetical protein R3C68_02215 [Myxococcota bacterium]